MSFISWGSSIYSSKLCSVIFDDLHYSAQESSEENIICGVQAIGCILYELCALKPAFDGTNLLSIICKIMKGTPEVNRSLYACFILLLMVSDVCTSVCFDMQQV
jgi:hypothetical protein